MIKMYFGLLVVCLLFLIFSTNFTHISNVMEIRLLGAEMFNADRRTKGRKDVRRDGRTDG